jgi:hypothetical protein
MRRLTLTLVFLALAVLLPTLAVGRPAQPAGGQTAATQRCVYLPMAVHGGTAAATVTPATPESAPCVEAFPNPNATATTTATGTSTSTATATGTATSTATASTTGTATRTATPSVTSTSTATPSPTSTLIPGSTTIRGRVGLYPETTLVESAPRPLQIVLVLDVSAAMSANARGQCNSTGTVVQCAAEFAPGDPPDPTGLGTTQWWNPPQGRRIWAAKQSLLRLVDLLNLPGNPTYNPVLPNDEVAVVWFNQQQTLAMTSNWSSDITTLKQAITNAGAYNGDQYRTIGGSNIAAGLYRSSLFLKQRPTSVNYNGKNWTYQRNVLLVTDGLANEFFDPIAVDLVGGPGNAETFPEGSECRNLGAAAPQTVKCQSTLFAGEYDPAWRNDRPITQVLGAADEFIKKDPQANAELFILDISGHLWTQYEDWVASFPAYYSFNSGYQEFSDGTTSADEFLNLIINTRNSSCEVRQDPLQWRIDAENAGSFPPPGSQFTYPVVGSVRLLDINGSYIFSVPVVAGAGPNGENSYVIENMSSGVYYLQAELAYRHEVDGVVRSYEQDVNDLSAVTFVKVTLSGSGTITQDFRLKHRGNICGEG